MIDNKHFGRLGTRSLGPTPLRFNGDNFHLQGKKVETRQVQMGSDDEVFNLKIPKQSFPNPVLSYKGQDAYQALNNRFKLNKPLNGGSQSLSYGINELNELIAQQRRESPVGEDESPFHIVTDPDEKGIKLHNLPVEDVRFQPPNNLKQLQLSGGAIPRLGTKGVNIIPMQKPKKKEAALNKLPSLDDPKEGYNIFKKKNDPLYDYEYFTGNESARMVRNISAQKLRKSPFYVYVRCKSPSSLINRKYLFKKEPEPQVPLQLSVPFSDVYQEIASKLLAGKKNIMSKNDVIYVEQIIDRKGLETHNQTPMFEKVSKTNGEMARERSPEIPSTMLTVSGIKKTLGNGQVRLSSKGFSKMSNIQELMNYEGGEGSEDELIKSGSKDGHIRFNSHGDEGMERGERINTEETEESVEIKQEIVHKEEENEVENNAKVIRLKKVDKNSLKPTGENTGRLAGIGSMRTLKKTKSMGAGVRLDPTELSQMKKAEAYRDFLQRITFSFNLQIKLGSEKAPAMYKFYVGKGNNHVLIRALMKTRWWWAQTDSKNPKDMNFMWTQWRNKKFIEGLAPKEQQEEAQQGESQSSTYTRAGDEELKGLVTDGLKRLFTKKELEMMEKNNSAFKNYNSKEYEELCKKKAGSKFLQITDPQNRKLCNHIEDNFHLANKKALLINMRNYYSSIGEDVFKRLPLTFHIKNGVDDEEYLKFVECYKQREKEIQEHEGEEKGKHSKKNRNIWIVKPGENTNKGKGISLVNDLAEVRDMVRGSKGNGSRTYLIQLYLDRPLLYNKRKFDIRCYMLISCINGIYKGYWYQDGYIRTSSKEFTLKNISNKQIHLTNDAIQKKYEEYSKYEPGNKVSYAEFERYLETTYGGTVDFYKNIYPQMKALATDTIKAVYGTVDPYKRENTFEVFGLDFMIDTSFNVWLIEVNTNPDICIPSPKLAVLIPTMVENALRLTIDPLFPPPHDISNKKQSIPENLLENNKFELVFDETEEGHLLRGTLKARQEGLKTLSPEDKEGEGEESDEEAKD